MNATVKAWIKDILIAVAIAVLITQFIKPTIVKEHSMEPTLQENDYIFLSRQSYLVGSPSPGDIIVFHSQLTTETGKKKLLIKRIVGIGGDTITIEDGKVYRNGELLDESYILEQYTSQIVEDAIIPEGKLFVMGDNRQNSADSRFPEVGLIDEKDVLGKAVFRLFPFQKIGLLH